MSEEVGKITVKIALIGSPSVGKTTLMVKYCKGIFSEDYIATLGVQFLEKEINVGGQPIVMSIWDIGGQKQFIKMLQVSCSEAHAILFMFDLTSIGTLVTLKEWYKSARETNPTALPILVGTKFDKYFTLSPQEKEFITRKAMKFAEVIGAPLVYCSSTHNINIKNLFKIIIGSVFNFPPNINKELDYNKPIIKY